MRQPVLRFAVIAVVTTAAAAPAWAQVDSREGIALQNQILELRRDLQIMQSQRGGGLSAPVPRGGGGAGGQELSAQLLDRVAMMEDEVRQLRGRLDELSNAVKRGQDDLAKQIADLSFKAQNDGGAPSPRSSSQPSAGSDPPPAAVRRPPERAMQEGNAALARRDYATAEAAAREALAGGRGPRATDAQFLLAQALAGKRDYQGAAIAYDDAYNRGRTGSRAPDALLGVANALLALNERSGACASLDKLRAEFSTLRTDVRQGAAALRTRAGCR